MNAALYARLMETLTYSAEAAARRHDSKAMSEVLAVRDDLRDRYPGLADAARDRAVIDAVPRFER